MDYEEEFWQEIVGIVIFLSILRAVTRRQNQQQSAAKTRNVCKRVTFAKFFPCNLSTHNGFRMLSLVVVQRMRRLKICVLLQTAH